MRSDITVLIIQALLKIAWHVQGGSSLKFSNSSQTVLSLVKYSVTVLSPCFIDAASICKSEILSKSPWKKRAFKSFQISSALSIHKILCLISEETECTIHDTTILLHRFHALYARSFFSASAAIPSTNWALFFVE